MLLLLTLIQRATPPLFPSFTLNVVNAILYVLRSGCLWRLLPKDLPPRSTVQRHLAMWRDDEL